MAKQMETFKVNLEEFAAKHKDDIRKDPEFRVSFQEMCASIGVDPLACKSVCLSVTSFCKGHSLGLLVPLSVCYICFHIYTRVLICIVFVASKGFWAEMLGVGDFYYELGVQIVEVCMATNHRNGGKVNKKAHYL